MNRTITQSFPGRIRMLGFLSCFTIIAISPIATAHDGALAGVRHRVVVSTDIGGTDPDDFQSMVHLFVYADVFDLEGLVSSPYGPGRKKHILEVIDAYEHDYPKLKSHSGKWGEWGNTEFVARHIAGHGALGELFVQAKADLKMGDTPSVARLLRGASEDPSQPGWGGRFVRIWDGRKTIFNRLTTEADKAEVFGVTEFVLPLPEGFSSPNTATMIFNGGGPTSEGVNEGRFLRFRFSPRDATVWSYGIKSDFVGLDGQSGKFTAVPPPVERTSKPSVAHPNWWIDDPDPDAAVGVHPGAKSVSRWREEFLSDFAERMDRCKTK